MTYPFLGSDGALLAGVGHAHAYRPRPPQLDAHDGVGDGHGEQGQEVGQDHQADIVPTRTRLLVTTSNVQNR